MISGEAGVPAGSRRPSSTCDSPGLLSTPCQEVPDERCQQAVERCQLGRIKPDQRVEQCGARRAWQPRERRLASWLQMDPGRATIWVHVLDSNELPAEQRLDQGAGAGLANAQPSSQVADTSPGMLPDGDQGPMLRRRQPGSVTPVAKVIVHGGQHSAKLANHPSHPSDAGLLPRHSAVCPHRRCQRVPRLQVARGTRMVSGNGLAHSQDQAARRRRA